MLGGAAGIAWSLAWPGSPSGAYAVVGAAAMLGAAMQAPLTGLVLMLELTSGGFGIMIPMIAATVTATVVARQVDGYSIYTARLRAQPSQRLGGARGDAPGGAHPQAVTCASAEAHRHMARSRIKSPLTEKGGREAAMTHLTYLEASVVGLIQGVTELFPVSSIGHNVLVPRRSLEAAGPRA